MHYRIVIHYDAATPYEATTIFNIAKHAAEQLAENVTAEIVDYP